MLKKCSTNYYYELPRNGCLYWVLSFQSAMSQSETEVSHGTGRKSQEKLLKKYRKRAQQILSKETGKSDKFSGMLPNCIQYQT